MMRAYRFRIYPSNRQIDMLNSTLNLCRELYNAMLEQRIYAYRSKKHVNYRSQQDEIPGIKERFPEFRNIHSLVVQDVAHRLDKAYDNFFRRVNKKKQGNNAKAGFPRFKSSDRYNSITYTQSGFRILDNGHVWLSRIGELRVFMHRSVTGDIRTISIKRDSVGDWFITVTADQYADIGTGTGDWKREQDLSSSHVFTNPIGIDLGLKALITTSDGMQMEPPSFLRKSEKKLKKAQRNLSFIAGISSCCDL